MPRNPNIHGGGARTNQNGLHFEQTTSLDDALCNAGYDVINHTVYRGTQQIGMSVPQKKLYTYFLNPRGITLDYIVNMGCHYFYNEIPLDFLGL